MFIVCAPAIQMECGVKIIELCIYLFYLLRKKFTFQSGYCIPV